MCGILSPRDRRGASDKHKIDFLTQKIKKIKRVRMQFIDVRDTCRVRNFHIANIIKLVGEQRKSAFLWFCTMWKSTEKRAELISNTRHSLPYDEKRYKFVSSEVERLSRNMTEITKKTRMCTRGTHDEKTCNFAHSDEEWVPPYCLWQEFCNVHTCEKNHGLKPDEYRFLHDMAPPVKIQSLVNTKFCQRMTENDPCGNVKCTFCHSISTLVPIHCDYKFCNNPVCTKKHSWDTLETYLKKQGIVIESWHLRPEEYNNWVEASRREKQETMLWIQTYTEEIKRLEENGWVDGDSVEINLTKIFEKMKVEEEEEEEEETLFTIFGKSSISLSEIVCV